MAGREPDCHYLSKLGHCMRHLDISVMIWDATLCLTSAADAIVLPGQMFGKRAWGIQSANGPKREASTLSPGSQCSCHTPTTGVLPAVLPLRPGGRGPHLAPLGKVWHLARIRHLVNAGLRIASRMIFCEPLITRWINNKWVSATCHRPRGYL